MHKLLQMNFGASDDNADDDLPRAVCNCLLIESSGGIILIDTGLGILENETLSSLSKKLENVYRIPIDPNLPAAKQLLRKGYNCLDVKHIVLTHLDLDHAGGLRDFPDAQVHLSMEEYMGRHDPRYLQSQFEHLPQWNPYPGSNERWFGLEARSVRISDEVDIKLVPLPGHTLGHCAVAIRKSNSSDQWVLHVGDAYYAREELYDEFSMIRSLSNVSSADNWQRLTSLAKIRQLLFKYSHQIDVLSSHDPAEIIADVSSAVKTDDG
jgi:glyoxylase-like metal-dependent hydrolase (beta-lactamase superfamily II)